MTNATLFARDEWIADRLAAHGRRMTGAETVRANPSGYVLAVRTDAGRCYFKACAEVTTHEPRLMAALAEWTPGDVPAVLAVDPARRWLLMADAGPTLRERVRADGDRTRSATMAERFAALQQALIPRVDDLLALGVPDRRLARLPARLDALLADAPALMIGQPDGLTAEDAARLRAFGPELRAICDELAAYAIPPTLHHDDFHSGNTGVRGDDYRFFDWGESFVAHPFYALMIALRDAKYVLEYDRADLRRLQDAYLACWTDYEPRPRLEAALALTHRLAALGRALTWWAVLQQADAAYRAEEGDAVPYWLQTFLHDTPLEA